MSVQVENAYILGFEDAKTRTRKRPMTFMYRLAYTVGWYDAKAGKPPMYK